MSFKKGDKVAMHSDSYIDHWHVEIVNNITPKGKIVTINDNDYKTTFNDFGTKRSTDRFSRGAYIAEITKEMLEERKLKNLIYKISKFKLTTLNMVQAEQIYNLLKSWEIKMESV